MGQVCFSVICNSTQFFHTHENVWEYEWCHDNRIMLHLLEFIQKESTTNWSSLHFMCFYINRKNTMPKMTSNS